MTEQRNVGTGERRAKPPPTTSGELLWQLPAHALLDRMPAPALGLGHDDGSVAYANASSAAMLGFDDVATLLDTPLPSLLAEHSLGSAMNCVAFLKTAGNSTVDWCHAEGFTIHTTVSTLLLRATDPILIIYINDITELVWGNASLQRSA